MVNEDELATKPNKGPRTVNPVVFYDRDEIPANQKDFRAKPVKVRPTVPSTVDVKPSPALVETEPAAATEPNETEPPLPRPSMANRPRPPVHPSSLPAKD